MDRNTKHWTDLSDDPNHPKVQSFLRETLLGARKERIGDVLGFVRDFVRGQEVLDIGVVAHHAGRIDDPNWKHNVIRSQASRVVGIDILEDEVRLLQERGYDVRCVDGTSDVDLGERFDRAVLGDVIEHVDNPVLLLKFAARHLKPGGLLLCSTPNPFFVVTLWQGLRSGVFIPNAEHVNWITPTMALELASRAGLTLDSYHHTQGDGKTIKRKVMVQTLQALGLRDAEMFSGAFYYIFRV